MDAVVRILISLNRNVKRNPVNQGYECAYGEFQFNITVLVGLV